jgi:hypothetical protein
MSKNRLRNLFARRPASDCGPDRRAGQRGRLRPALESLEGRQLLSAFSSGGDLPFGPGNVHVAGHVAGTQSAIETSPTNMANVAKYSTRGSVQSGIPTGAFGVAKDSARGSVQSGIPTGAFGVAKDSARGSVQWGSPTRCSVQWGTPNSGTNGHVAGTQSAIETSPTNMANVAKHTQGGIKKKATGVTITFNTAVHPRTIDVHSQVDDGSHSQVSGSHGQVSGSHGQGFPNGD